MRNGITPEMREKANEIVKKLTLDEKIGMIHGCEFFRTKGVERLGIPPLVSSDGPMGVRPEYMPDDMTAIGETSDAVTYLPCNSAVASTWSRELARKAGDVLGSEARGRGKDIILAPGVNIKRSPLCGRNFEYFSEDPYLTGELASEIILGVQEWDVAACVKHFACNSQETDRFHVDSVVDENVLREIYLPAFYKAITKGNAYTLMGSYNKINGEHGSQSITLLQKILRDEWGYEGAVLSDWGGVHNTDEVAASGLDIEMDVDPDFDNYYMAEPLKKKIESGEIDETLIDRKVFHILTLMMRLHMFDSDRNGGCYNSPDNRKAALDVARESIILLKNEDGQLPMNKNKIKRLLVIGENADRQHALGGGSAEIKALYELTPLTGIRMLLGGNVTVKYVKGYSSDVFQYSMYSTKYKQSRTLRDEAVALAKEYDDVVFVGGLNHTQTLDCEGWDKKSMKLPYCQDELISALLDVCPNMKIVMVAGSPVEMDVWADRAKSIVWMYYNGIEGGRALAEVLFGDVNPSGKLAETMYHDPSGCGAHVLGETGLKDRVEFRDGIFVGYRYTDRFGVAPRFPFGHGLSYTTFDKKILEISEDKSSALVSVKNTGSIPGKEVAAVYGLNTDPSRPVRELTGFEKIFLLPGEEKQIQIDLEKEFPSYEIG